ncbi:hypothetical protein [Aurantimonas coralicida]|uniref:hypothetical protein n=1 Tax=Aurantimonas coralicida TaxID=182270 RepID=UPI001E62ACF9|nr:hypothetical protein [Aurantimonas coralicida]MCD1645678.1 hypothetical protein [Aurantimonas coralicida]
MKRMADGTTLWFDHANAVVVLAHFTNVPGLMPLFDCMIAMNREGGRYSCQQSHSADH